MVSNTTTLERVCVIVVEWGKQKDKGGSSQEHKVIKQALTRYVSLCTEGERLVNVYVQWRVLGEHGRGKGGSARHTK